MVMARQLGLTDANRAGASKTTRIVNGTQPAFSASLVATAQVAGKTNIDKLPAPVQRCNQIVSIETVHLSSENED